MKRDNGEKKKGKQRRRSRRTSDRGKRRMGRMSRRNDIADGRADEKE